jgi:hypothetical protein
MSRYEAPENLMSEAYLVVRRSEEDRGERSRWALFIILLGYPFRNEGRIKTASEDAVTKHKVPKQL